ncbi:MAG TPA: hypothetical protein VEX38_05035 [Fimbriimonadaceae bacterium]|nr:hypothetical protein [Fimbriimonadaceae bacterium]
MASGRSRARHEKEDLDVSTRFKLPELYPVLGIERIRNSDDDAWILCELFGSLAHLIASTGNGEATLMGQEAQYALAKQGILTYYGYTHIIQYYGTAVEKDSPKFS